jgi:ribose/xylose/arabinose/galactoside ABC-type transport system permease subunit
LITTLGMLYAARGLVNVVTNGQPYYPFPNSFNNLAQGMLFGLPYPIYYAIALGILAWVVLDFTPLGANIRAIGGNRVAARAAGIKVNRIAASLYVFSGLAAAFAGILESGRLSSAQPSYGDGLELQVISAVIIGGTSLFGGIGTLAGTALGALLLGVLANGLVVMGVEAFWQDVIVGVVIVVAVGLDRLRRSRMWRS